MANLRKISDLSIDEINTAETECRCSQIVEVVLTVHTKQVSCHVWPRASINLSPASTGKSQPWHLVLKSAM